MNVDIALTVYMFCTMILFFKINVKQNKQANKQINKNTTKITTTATTRTIILIIKIIILYAQKTKSDDPFVF